MRFAIESVSPVNQAEMIEFLKMRENFSLFLLSNFENYGPKLSDEPYSGNYKLIRSTKDVVGVFCLTRRGSLLIESLITYPIFEQILASCKIEPIPLKGLVGNWMFCEPFWGYLKDQRVIQQETFFSKEILYAIDLSLMNTSSNFSVNFFTESDFSEWKKIQFDYIKEKKLPNELTEAQLFKQFQNMVQNKIAWGIKINNHLVSIALLNAKAFDLGQVGGVYTKPKYRRKGYSKAVLQQLFYDCQHHHQMRKLVIFTDDKNSIVKNLYVKLGARPVGYFSLLFGE